MTLVILFVFGQIASAESPYRIAWTQQLGTSGYDPSNSVAVDIAGNVFISGRTDGNLDGNNAGEYDAFLAKYDSAGNLSWTKQLGTSSDDYSYSVAVDGTGNVFISGSTYGSLGGTSAGGADAFLAMYDSDGNRLWTQQLGTSEHDTSYSVAVDLAGNAFISGWTYGSLDGENSGKCDTFLAKYNSDGTWQWTQQLGTPSEDNSMSVAVDGAGNVFISGFTYGSLGSPNAGFTDAFLVKYEVPEPATLSLLALGGLALIRRRK